MQIQNNCSKKQKRSSVKQNVGLICSRELLILAGTGTIGRFVSENERESGDINTVSSSHVETVVLLSKGEIDSKNIRVAFSMADMDTTDG